LLLQFYQCRGVDLKILHDHIDGALGSITARQLYFPNEVPTDSAARLESTRFNFILAKPGGVVERETLFVPWFTGADMAAKTSLGQAIATQLSGPAGTYTFRS